MKGLNFYSGGMTSEAGFNGTGGMGSPTADEAMDYEGSGFAVEEEGGEPTPHAPTGIYQPGPLAARRKSTPGEPFEGTITPWLNGDGAAPGAVDDAPGASAAPNGAGALDFTLNGGGGYAPGGHAAALTPAQVTAVQATHESTLDAAKRQRLTWALGAFAAGFLVSRFLKR